MASETRYDRQELLFGRRGQQKIEALKVGIVGLGGLGSHVAQQLAYLGVSGYALVDGDRVTLSSLNRVVGAVPADAEEGTWKVDAAAGLILSIQPEARVHVSRAWLEDASSLLEGTDAIPAGEPLGGRFYPLLFELASAT